MANTSFSWKNLIGSGLFGSLRSSMRREIKTRHRKVRRQMFMEQMESRLNLAFGVYLSGNHVYFQGTSGTDSVTLTEAGSGHLQHSIPLSGNLVSAIDLDGTQPGEQAILKTDLWSISVYCGDGNDTVTATNWPGIGIYMVGEGGADILRGGAGDDYIVGGDGNDTLAGNGGDDYLYGESGTDNLTGGLGNDYLDGGADIDSLTGGADDDWLVITAGDTFTGNGGNDTATIYEATQVTITNTTATINGVAQTPLIENYSGIYGTENADTINASTWTGPGITIYGYGGDDVLKGGSGNDYINGGLGNDTLEGNGGNDDLRGGVDSDTLNGGAGDDWLDWNEFDGASADLFIGGAGDDHINANSLDEFHGGADSDWVALNDINVLTLTDTTASFGGAPFNHGTENWYYIYGTEDSDLIDASAWTGPGIAIYGFGGDDILKGGAGADYIDGGAGNDSIDGNGGDDNILGGDDNDTIHGGEGNDYLNWYEGYYDDSDLLYGGEGDDYLAPTGGDEFHSGADYDRVYLWMVTQVVITDTTIALNGNAPFNHETEEWYTISGTENADSIDLSVWTGPGASIYGSGGDDVIKGGAGADYLIGGAGNDILEGNAGNDDLRGGDDNDSLFGGEGDDYLDWYEYYSSGNDLLMGGAGDDYLYANSLDEFNGGDDFDQVVLNEITMVTLTDAAITFGGVPFSHGTEFIYAIYGTDNDDVIDASAWTGPGITIYGYEGNNLLKGGAGDDVILAGAGADTIEGNGGNDDLRGGQGDDLLLGGEGNDYLNWHDYYDNYDDNDQMFGGAGDDYIKATATDVFHGEADTDHVYLFNVSDVVLTDSAINIAGVIFAHDIESWEIHGTHGPDVIDASAWTGVGITMHAYDGDDHLIGSFGDDSLHGGAGADILEGRDGDDYLDGEYWDSEVDTFYPGKGSNTVSGSYYYGDDVVFADGEIGDDVFFAHYYGYVLNDASTYVYNVAAITYNTNGGDDVATADDGLPYTLIINGLKPSISAVRLGLTVHGIFRDAGDNQTWTGTIDFGDGPVELTLEPDKTFSFTLPYEPTEDVVVTITDNQSNVGTTFVAVPSLDLAGDTVDENIGAYNPIGVLSFANLPYFSEGPYTYEFTSGEGDDDNAEFYIYGDQLYSYGTYDFESKSSYTVRVRVTDEDGLTLENVFTIFVNDVNEAPSAPALDNDTIDENLPAGSTVGILTSTDPDAGDIVTYSLVDDYGDNGSFTIDGGVLKSAASFDYETISYYYILVRATDAEGLYTDSYHTIYINNVNDAPSDITLSNDSLPENEPAGTYIGGFSAFDEDDGSFTFSLVSGTGSTDNGQFAIVDGNLTSSASFDYESSSVRYIRVRATDNGGAFFEKQFTISITNVNEAPTNITVSPSSIPENQPAGSTVGALATVDPDAGDTFTYVLVAGAGSADNSSFTIASGVLKTTASFDYETKNTYSIRVRSTDAGGLTTEKILSITVSDVSEGETTLELSNSSLAENNANGQSIGVFSLSNPPASSQGPYTYALIAGTGSTDNSSFQISNDALLAGSSFDYEAKSSYSIRVQVTDEDGLTFENVFVISVTNVNEAPTNIDLSNSSIAENQSSGSTIGSLSSTDQDVGDSFTYTLVSGTGSADNASFSIDNGVLKTAASFNFEVKNSYSVRIRSTDAGGLFTEKAFTIGVTNINETPTDIGLSNNSIAENQPSGSTIGSLTSTDPDAGDSFTYTLVTGAGSTDNASFTIESGVLKTTASFDFETKSSYTVRVRTTDVGGLFTEKAFTIGVTNVNETPTDIGLSNNSIAENQPFGSTIGSLTSTDPDAGDSFTYTLVTGAGSTDNASFTIDGGVLKTNASFNFEVKNSYTVRVRTTDAGGLFTEKAFAIGVTNVNETPTDIGLSNNSIAEALPSGSNVGVLSTLDPDAGDSFTYTLVSGTGSDDNASFAIVGGDLRTSAVFDYEVKNSYSVRVRSTDGGGLSTEKVFTIGVIDVGESAPPAIGGITGAAAVVYKENAVVPVVISSAATVADPDSIDFDGGALTVWFSENGSADDRLSIKNTGDTTGKIGVDDGTKTIRYSGVQIATYTGGVGTTPLVITFNASAGRVAVQAALKAITFANISDDPSVAPREVSFSLTDGDGGVSNTSMRTVNVTAVNDKPLVTASGSLVGYTENGAPVVVDPGVLITDADSANFDLGKLVVKSAVGGQSSDRFGIAASGLISVSGNTVSYDGTPIGTFAGTNSLTVTLNSAATPERVQELARHVVFSNISDAPSTTPRQISFTVADGDGGTSLAALGNLIDLTPVNDAPVLTLSNATNAKYTENALPTSISSAGTVVDVDLLNFDGGVLTVAITGNATADDLLSIKHTDPANAKVSVDYTLGKIFYTTTALGTYEVASFTGGEGANPLVIAFNANALKTEVQAVFKAITFATNSDNPSIATRTVSFTLTDGDGGTSDTVVRSVDVIAKNDAPGVASFGPAVNYTLNGSPAIITDSAVVTDIDSTDFNTGKLTVALGAGKNSLDRVEVSVGNGITVLGNVVSYNGNAIGTFAGTTTLTITFNSAFATPDAVQALLRQLTFRTTASSSRTVALTVKLTDGDGGTSAVVSKEINITNAVA